MKTLYLLFFNNYYSSLILCLVLGASIYLLNEKFSLITLSWNKFFNKNAIFIICLLAFVLRSSLFFWGLPILEGQIYKQHDSQQLPLHSYDFKKVCQVEYGNTIVVICYPLYYLVTHFFNLDGVFLTAEVIVRVVSLLLGCLVVFLMYKLSIQLFSKREIAIINALLIALSFEFIVLSPLSTQDMFLMFFLLLSFYLSLKLRKDSSFISFFLVGIAIGFLSGTKWIMLSFLFIPWYLMFLQNLDFQLFKKLAFLTITAGILFLFLTPQWSLFTGSTMNYHKLVHAADISAKAGIPFLFWFGLWLNVFVCYGGSVLYFSILLAVIFRYFTKQELIFPRIFSIVLWEALFLLFCVLSQQPISPRWTIPFNFMIILFVGPSLYSLVFADNVWLKRMGWILLFSCIVQSVVLASLAINSRYNDAFTRCFRYVNENGLAKKTSVLIINNSYKGFLENLNFKIAEPVFKDEEISSWPEYVLVPWSQLAFLENYKVYYGYKHSSKDLLLAEQLSSFREIFNRHYERIMKFENYMNLSATPGSLFLYQRYN